jgi:hypothetical protein
VLSAVVLVLAGMLAVAASDRVLAAELVMFEEAGCPWCRRFDREIAPAYPKTEEGRRAPLRRIHISLARTSGLGLARPVTVTPTFVLVSRGVEVGRITGYPGEEFFWGLLSELLTQLEPGPRAKPAPAGRDAGQPRSCAVGAPAEAAAHGLADRTAGGLSCQAG